MMRTAHKVYLMIFALVAVSSDAAAAGPICRSVGDGKVRCTIETLADCQATRDFPYARNLFCPTAFSAVQTMTSALAATLGAGQGRGFFHFFQTLPDPQDPPDDQAQTTIACLDTPAPWGGRTVVGAGTPLCHLIAYVTSLGPVEGRARQTGNPVPTDLRAFPRYFSRLYDPGASLVSEFQVGFGFDAIVRRLGAAAAHRFLEDYPLFSPDALYDPADFQRDARYHGISGGGGGGWGGEIGIVRPGTDRVLLAFGGGGGGGMTSMRTFSGTSSRVGSGGGGGMQFADGYRFQDRPFNGLGLGAGAGSDESNVQYSYYDYEGSGRPASPVHEYNPAVIADYQQQLSNLTRLLKSRFMAGDTIVLRGGGGMGAGAEYLMENGEEFVPHALSTQAGFEFQYEFQRRIADSSVVASADAVANDLDPDLAHAYELLGDFYRTATAQAYDECGRDYANFSCMCPKTHATVLCLVGQELGDPTKIPAWLQQQHCPNDPELPNQRINGLTSYQHVLLDSVSDPVVSGDSAQAALQPRPCGDILLEYFESVNGSQ